MKLKRLKIERFRGVEPGTEILFGEGFNVLLGQNGTGKTTLLRLISSVFVGDFRWLAGESFGVEYELQLGSVLMRGVLKNEDVPAQPGDLPGNRRAKFELHVRSNEEMVVFRFDGDSLTITREESDVETRRDFRADPLYAIFATHLFALFATQIRNEVLGNWEKFFDGHAHVLRFDESLEVFSAMTGRTSELGLPEYGRGLGQISISMTAATRHRTVVGRLVMPKLCQDAAAVDIDSPMLPSSLWFTAAQSPFLADLAGLMGLLDARMQLDFLGKQATEQGSTVEYGNLRFFFTRRDGSIINQDHLSYGQKRLLTFYYYLACNPYVVIADELVNGLHHSWIAECMKAMGDRQVFLTSQNPILLDHLSFDSADAVRKTFVTCLAIPEGPKDRLLWGNMSKKDAASFYKAYKVGIQHVGEILRTKGLW